MVFITDPLLLRNYIVYPLFWPKTGVLGHQTQSDLILLHANGTKVSLFIIETRSYMLFITITSMTRYY